jgi:hypothetical protein
MLFINKRDFIKSKLKNKTVLFVNCYHPIAKEIIFFLSNLLKKEIRSDSLLAKIQHMFL